MPRRKEIKNIAQGIASSFISRNNDVDGYWELAKLYDLSTQNKGTSVSINLLNASINPASEKFDTLISYWISKLLAMLESRSIPVTWLNSAVILTNFDQVNDVKLHSSGEYGEPCTCICKITTDNGTFYSGIAGTRCMPFSKASFQRSTRRKGL